MPTRDNGTSLAERLIPQALTNAAATFVDSVKLSSVSERVRRGRRVVLKRRNAYSEQLADLGNLYFRISNIPIRFWSKVEDWRRWEAPVDLPTRRSHADFRRRSENKARKAATADRERLPGCRARKRANHRRVAIWPEAISREPVRSQSAAPGQSSCYK